MSKKFYYTVVHPLARAAGVANLFDILSDRKERHLLGYPVEFVSAMPSAEANDQVCAVLGDLKLGAYLGERRQLEIAKSDDVYFANDQIGIRGTERVDINAHGVGDTVLVNIRHALPNRVGGRYSVERRRLGRWLLGAGR